MYRSVIDDRAINYPYTVIVDIEIFIDRRLALLFIKDNKLMLRLYVYLILEVGRV